MPKQSRYFRKDLEEGSIWVKYQEGAPGEEILVAKTGEKRISERDFDEDILEDLAADEFEEVNAMAYELIKKGLA